MASSLPVRIALLAIAALAIVLRAPPGPLPASAPAAEFSADRALVHLGVIAARPRPVGSEHHTAVRSYLLDTFGAFGLETSVQRDEEVSNQRVPGRVLHNVIAVLPGSDRAAPAVVLAAHYDSVAAGPGASDDGAAVAAMLETVRALRAWPQSKRDLIFLVTDAEEVGLVGAQAFVARHELAKRVGVLCNFEARGSRGPAYMFETSGPTAWLASSLAATSRRPFATSIAVEIYKRMPNLTDFTVFSRAGIRGMNFAYIDGYADYHTANDDLAHLGHGSLQHHGETMLGLARHFTDADLEAAPQGDAVYFDVAGRALVRYPIWLVMPLALLACAALAWVLTRTLRGVARPAHVALLGVCSVALAIATTAALGTALGAAAWSILGRRAIEAPRLGFVLVASIAIASWCASTWLFGRLARNAGAPAVAATGLVWQGVLALATAWALPAASYVFTLTTLTGAALVALASHARFSRAALLASAAAPAILVLAPTADAFFVAMPQVPGATGVLLLLVVAALGPALAVRASRPPTPAT